MSVSDAVLYICVGNLCIFTFVLFGTLALKIAKRRMIMCESKFQFEDLVLEELEFNINPNFYTDETPVDMKNIFKTRIIKSIDSNDAIVKLEIYTNINNKEDTPFTLKVIISAKFSWEELEPNVADKMLHTNAPALLLSYARPIVANITGVSPFPAYHLPLMNFDQTVE